MYKIYINDTPVYFKESTPNVPLKLDNDAQHLSARYTGLPKSLLNYADMLEKGNRFQSVTLYTNDLEGIQRDFLSLFELLEAAGGIVRTPEGKLLLIFRLGHWDLPKGKLEPGEIPEEAAVREVEEETGITGIQRSELFDITYHTYRTGKGKRIVKRTYWYLMNAPEQVLVPQTEENIQSAVWAFPEEYLNNPAFPFYRSIHDLLSAATETP